MRRRGRCFPDMKVEVGFRMVDSLLIGRLLAGVGWEEEVVEEAFLPVADCLLSDRWAPGWVLGCVLL